MGKSLFLLNSFISFHSLLFLIPIPSFVNSAWHGATAEEEGAATEEDGTAAEGTDQEEAMVRI